MGRNPTDQGKQSTKRSVLSEGGEVPIGLCVAGANCNDVKSRVILIRGEKKATNFLGVLHPTFTCITFKQASLLGWTLRVVAPFGCNIAIEGVSTPYGDVV